MPHEGAQKCIDEDGPRAKKETDSDSLTDSSQRHWVSDVTVWTSNDQRPWRRHGQGCALPVVHERDRGRRVHGRTHEEHQHSCQVLGRKAQRRDSERLFNRQQDDGSDDESEAPDDDALDDRRCRVDRGPTRRRGLIQCHGVREKCRRPPRR